MDRIIETDDAQMILLMDLKAVPDTRGELNIKPGINWVEKFGGLPAYIDKIAGDIHYERGKTVESAVAIAISRVRAWCRGEGDVSEETKAKSCAAAAQWEALKAKAKAAGVVSSLLSH